MARIMIENLFRRTLDVSDLTKTLLEHFQDNAVDWMHACGAKGRCTTCKVVIRQGRSNFQELTAAEKKYFAERALNSDERLACQTKIYGDITIVAPEEYQLPHVLYSE